MALDAELKFTMPPSVLALNSGSSSLKFGLFLPDQTGPVPLFRGSLDGIASGQGRLQIFDRAGHCVIEQSVRSDSHSAAVHFLVKAISRLHAAPPDAVGHRIVHGGPSVRQHVLITPEILQALESSAHFAPLHVPIALELIRESQRLYPDTPQFACLDTAFHRTIPEVASRFAIPDEFWRAGIRRYGFHGISCESILQTLGSSAPSRLVIAHLGNGASITAVLARQSVDTTMGLTPTGGIVMGTRPGDLDPGILIHLARHMGKDFAQLEGILNKHSGLLGLSGISSDMRELRASSDPRAQLAIDAFCRAAQKAIAGFIAVLGGLDLLVFTGGIGEHDSAVRERICSALAPMGIRIDPASNERHLRYVQLSGSSARVAVIPTEEEAQIARIVLRLSADSANRS